MLPPSARSTLKIDVTQLPRADTTTPPKLQIVFTDGKKMDLKPELGIRDVVEEVERYSRVLGRAEELRG